MKINRFKPYVFFFGIVFFILLIVRGIKEVTYSNNLMKEIGMGYRSIIVSIYNPRECVKDPNYMKVRKTNDEEMDVYLTEELLKYITVGDSLIKIKDENICYVKKPNGEKKQFYYTRISMKDRSHWTFPKEWKNKWMESSAWDTLQR